MSEYSDSRTYNCNTYGHGIVAHNCLARQYGEFGVQVRVLLMGTFVQVHLVRDEDVLFCVVQDDMQVDGIQMVGKKTDIINIPDSLWGPLFTVENMSRLLLVRDSRMAESLGNISVGHLVQVLGPDGEVACLADVTFKNSIARLGVGIFFGLKVLEPRENLQNLIERLSILKPGTKGFPRGCDIVVTIDKIRPANISKEKSIYNSDRESQKRLVKSLSGVEDVNSGTFKSMISFKFSNMSKKNHHASSPDSESNTNHSSRKISGDSLAVGDQVIFLDGETPEKGVVRWIGYIGSNLKVGVEFENPIGNCSGIVEGVGELFKAKFNHALLLPPLALIKLCDYLTNSTKETKKNNNNNKNNNNINNNNNNINNNSDYRGGDSCCKQNNEEKYRVSRKVSVSQQCPKHPERTYDSNELLKDVIRTGPKTELESQHCSRSFDYVTSGERKRNYRRSCSSMDNELLQNKDSNTYWTQLNRELYESSGVKEEKSPEYHDGEKKSQKCYDDDLILFTAFSHSNEKNTRSCKKVPVLELLSKKSDRGDGTYDVPSSNVRRVSCMEESSCCCRGFCRECHKNTYKEEFYEGRRHTLAHADGKHDSEWMLLRKDNWDSQNSEHSSSEENLQNFYDPPKPPYSDSHIPEDLGKGSVVELMFKGEPHYGVIRWIGTISDERDDLIAGVEMEEESSVFTDGTFNNKRYFTCNPKKALFVPLNKCRKDSRFSDETPRPNISSTVNYGQIDCPVVEGTIPPIDRKGDIESICGKNRGIQGHHNSCYLDATLFSMFSFTSVFDSLLYRPPTKNDIPQYTEVQRVLREEIVNPLRKNLYVRADRVMKLRTLLDKLSSVSGLTSEEKDPEEFLNCLLAQILKAEPFLKLSSGQEAFHYQLFVEKDERLVLPSVQQLFEQSFVTSDIKLKQVPSCLIIQMPRFGKSFKMYSRILPPQLLDITDIIENSPRQCTVCGQLAEFECKDCFGQQGIGNGLESISFCKSCLETAHNHHCRTRHNSRALTVPVEFSELQEHCIIPRLYMELFAVVCIETSHYVAFVKCGSGSDAPWCFFDSMADRKGEQNGYNIPEMVPCPDLPYWLSEEGAKMLNEMRDERQLPEHAKRLFSDAYMCMYQSPDLMMYR